MATTLALRNNTGLTAATVNSRWRTGIAGVNTRPFHPVNMLVGYNIVETYVLNCDAGGVITAHSDLTPIVGTRVANGMPVNTSIIVAKDVIPVGRQYRGRMLWPPCYLASTSVDSDGVILPAQRVNLTSFASQMWSYLNTNSLTPVLLHQPPQGGGGVPGPTLISGFTVGPRIGTIRHRIRR